jgi:hypothetical protein
MLFELEASPLKLASKESLEKVHVQASCTPKELLVFSLPIVIFIKLLRRRANESNQIKRIKNKNHKNKNENKNTI